MFLFHLHLILDTITCPLFQKQFNGEISVQKRLMNLCRAVFAMGCSHRTIVANVANVVLMWYILIRIKEGYSSQFIDLVIWATDKSFKFGTRKEVFFRQ